MNIFLKQIHPISSLVYFFMKKEIMWLETFYSGIAFQGLPADKIPETWW